MHLPVVLWSCTASDPSSLQKGSTQPELSSRTVLSSVEVLQAPSGQPLPPDEMQVNSLLLHKSTELPGPAGLF